MKEESINRLINAFERSGFTMFEYATRRVYVTGFFQMIVALLLLSIIIIALVSAYQLAENNNASESATFIVLSFISIIPFGIFLYLSMRNILATEFRAIELIANLF